LIAHATPDVQFRVSVSALVHPIPSSSLFFVTLRDLDCWPSPQSVLQSPQSPQLPIWQSLPPHAEFVHGRITTNGSEQALPPPEAG